MVSFSASATGKTTGQATLSGLSTVSYSRTVYVSLDGPQERIWSIPADANPTSYTQNFTGLSIGTKYTATWSVYKDSPVDLLASGSDDFITLAPDAPTISASGGDGEVDFTWNWPTGATKFLFYPSPGSSYIVYTNSETISGLGYDTQRCASVRAGGPDMFSVESNTACASSDPASSDPPEKPFDVGVTNTTTTSITWSWASTSNTNYYKLTFSGDVPNWLENPQEQSAAYLTNLWLMGLDSSSSQTICLEVQACNNDGCSSAAGPACGTSPADAPLKVATPELTIQSLTEVPGGLQLVVNYQSSSVADSFTISLTGFANQTDDGPIGGATFSPLAYGSSYNISAKASKSGYTDSDWSDPVTITPALLSTPSSISYNTNLQSQVSHTINFSSVTNATAYRVEYSLDDDPLNWSQLGYSYSPDTYIEHAPTIAMVGKSIRYRVRASAPGYVDSGWKTGAWALILATDGWQWTLNELKAFEKNGTLSERVITNLTWERWNDFVDSVEGTVNWFNSVKGTTVPSVLSAKLSSANKTLTATKFNTVRFSIGSMNATGITDRYANDPVLGSYFITLANKLNEVE